MSLRLHVHKRIDGESSVCGHRGVCHVCRDHLNGDAACWKCAGSGMLPADGFSTFSGIVACDLCKGAKYLPCWSIG